MSGFEQAIPALYDELRELARRVARNPRGRTLEATALVHEVFLKLAAHEDYSFAERAQVMGLAARAMRQVLADQARALGRHKRGGGALRVTLAEDLASVGGGVVDALALHEALDRLSDLDPQALEVVELRCVAGLSIEETAAALGISPATVKRDAAVARAFLLRELTNADHPAP